ncbi:TIGR01212 family radical SAM protein [Ruminococcus sp.]|uniref:TIGR01212 family radical SAM protein n=1 Tax=Ruminococcus sp. TaxID=41978 RepID=UPI003864571B
MYYYSLNEYLKNTFGEKVYKISLDGGMTCPNRDGKIDTRGCIFCSRGGSGEFSASRNLSITQQIEEAKGRIRKKSDCKKFIAYFQPFTNTYASVEYLRRIFTEAIENPEIVALSVATRPDCLPDDTIALLSELNKIKPVWVELGLQTIHENTAEYIRRGYKLSVYDNAVKRLHNENISVITHIIIGLPNETEDMIVESAKYAGEHSDGIKLQLLHILKDTDLCDEYEKGNVTVLTLEQYADILIKCLKVIPKTTVIHRLTGDGDKKILVAPMWSADKKRVLNFINKAIKATPEE